MSENYTPRLKARYRTEIRENLQKEFSFENVMQIPGVSKVVVNMGVGEAARDSKQINGSLHDLTLITGQKPELRRAKKSIAQFKLREGMPIGVKVTLRRERMYEFLDRFITIALPRVRDFRGLNPKSFDGRGNYALGIKEQLIFPEIEYDKIDKIRGLDVVMCTTAHTDEEAKELLTLIGAPFAR